MDPGFWLAVESVRDLISPISEQQKMSESEKSHVGMVYSRWLDVKHHLQSLTSIQPNILSLLPFFESRFNTQTNDIHLVAHYLNPKNIGKQDYSVEQFNLILKFLEKYGGEKAKFQFASFLIQQGQFAKHHEAWTLADHPLLFWALIGPFAPELSHLAVQVFKTPANSVPSERSFSSHNLIHDKKRNRLQVDKVDKLVFIHKNMQVLEKGSLGWNSLSEEELVELEDDIVVSFSVGTNFS